MELVWKIVSVVLVLQLSFSLALHSLQLESIMQDWGRIIIDLEILKSANGVSVDYSYNETKSTANLDSKNVVISAPGCPKSLNGTPWIQHGEPPRCYFPGYQGPCNVDEILLQEEQNPYEASCWCVADLDEEDASGKYVFTRNDPQKVYSFETKKCYKLGSQGPCEKNYILLKMSSNNTVQCITKFQGRCEFNYQIQTCDAVNLSPPPGINI